MEKDRSGKNAAEALSTFVNHMGFNKRGFVEGITTDHRFLQQEMFDLFFSCMTVWAKQFKDQNYDDRNRAACDLSNKFMQTLGI